MTLKQTIMNIERNSDKSKEGFLTGLGRGRKVPIIQALSLYFMGLTGGCVTTSNAYAQPDSEYVQNVPQAEPKYEGELWSKIGPTLDTPEKVADFLIKNIKYKSEPVGVQNHTQTPEETLELKTADCEDYAYVVVTALKNVGYEAGMFTIEYIFNGKVWGHTVGVYKSPKTGKLHYIQGYNGTYIDGRISKPYNNLDEIAKSMCIDMKVDYYNMIYETPEEYVRGVDNNPNLKN